MHPNKDLSVKTSMPSPIATTVHYGVCLKKMYAAMPLPLSSLIHPSTHNHALPPIVVAAGGSGGHVFPAIAFAEYARTKNHPVILMTDGRGARFINTDKHLFQHIEILPQPHWRSALDLYNAIRKIYALWRPKTALGFGGMMTIAPLLIAKMSMRCGVHQSDAIMGKANRFLSYFMNQVFVGHPLERYAAIIPKSRSTHWHNIGIPTRQAFKKILAHAQLPVDRHILVLGGSQGAQIWSEMLPKALELLPTEIQKTLHIRHQCPLSDQDALIERYAQMNLASFHIAPFFSNMSETLAWSHVVFSRAGASTLAELAQCHRPAFLVPYPYAANKHQHANALSYAEHHRAWVQDQSTLTPQNIAAQIHSWMDKPDQLIYSSNQTKTHPDLDACSELYNFCLAP